MATHPAARKAFLSMAEEWEQRAQELESKAQIPRTAV
jgi:hypothetical protein